MATITHGGTLPNSSNKTDFYAIIDNATIAGIVNADISAAAAIADSKLAQITTASKVSGAALTSLTSVPSGAGALPTANLPTIPYSKLSLTNAVLNADLAGSIADTKLSTISTAGKVSGASLTSLSSIPSGAGLIPLANLPPQGLTLVSATTFSGDTSKTISGLSPGDIYLLILDLTAASGNEQLVFFPNGVLAAINATANYSASGGAKKLLLHSDGGSGSGFNSATTTKGSWNINFRTIQGDNTKTIINFRGTTLDSSSGFDTPQAGGVIASDSDLSSITIGNGGTMTLTGTAYLYKYATS